MADNLNYKDGTGVPKQVMSREVAPDLHLPVVASNNFTRKFRDPFEVWPNERWRLPLPVNVLVSIEFPTELLTTVNVALNANLSAVGTVRANFQGYTSA